MRQSISFASGLFERLKGLFSSFSTIAKCFSRAGLREHEFGLLLDVWKWQSILAYGSPRPEYFSDFQKSFWYEDIKKNGMDWVTCYFPNFQMSDKILGTFMMQSCISVARLVGKSFYLISSDQKQLNVKYLHELPRYHAGSWIWTSKWFIDWGKQQSWKIMFGHSSTHKNIISEKWRILD